MLSLLRSNAVRAGIRHLVGYSFFSSDRTKKCWIGGPDLLLCVRKFGDSPLSRGTRIVIRCYTRCQPSVGIIMPGLPSCPRTTTSSLIRLVRRCEGSCRVKLINDSLNNCLSA